MMEFLASFVVAGVGREMLVDSRGWLLVLLSNP